MKISRKKSLAAVIALCSMMGFYYYSNLMTYNSSWINETAIFIIILFLTQLVLVRKVIPPKRVIIYVVLAFLFIFHFSHIILQAVQYDFGSNTRNNVFFRFNDNIVYQATHYGIEGSIGIFIGIVLYYTFYKKRRIRKEKLFIEKDNCVLAIIFVVIGLIADITYSLNSIIAMFTGGYALVQESLTSMFYGVRVVSYLLLAGILLLLQNDRLSLQRKKIILYIFIGYKILMMLSGLRAYGLINILLCLYVFYRNVDKIKFNIKFILLGLLALQLGGGLIIGIREARTTGMELGSIIGYMFDIRSNIVFNMMSEFGITENVLCVLASTLEGIASGGKQLLYSFIIIIPGIGSIAPGLDYDNAFMESKLNIHNYGGTYIGDMLYDFGALGLLLSCIVLGLFFAFLYEWYERNIEEGHKINVAVASPIIVDFIFCVRSSLAKMPRMIAWYLAVAGVLVLLTNSFSRKSRKRIR